MKKFSLLLLVVGILGGLAYWTYRRSPPSYYQEVFVRFSNSEQPIIEAQIQGKRYSMGIDSGSCFSAMLPAEVLESLCKQSCGEEKWYDIRGNLYTSPSYRLEKVTFGDFVWRDILVQTVSKACCDSQGLYIDNRLDTSKMPDIAGKFGWLWNIVMGGLK